jgi:hypothetical protein
MSRECFILVTLARASNLNIRTFERFNKNREGA